MPDLPAIFASVIAKCGEKARPHEGEETLHYQIGFECWCWSGAIHAVRSHPRDAANAIAMHWLGMLLAVCAADIGHDPDDGAFYVESSQGQYRAPTLIEALAAAVQGECAK